MNTTNLIHNYRGFSIERFLVREAYARSGNAHNATKIYSYAVKNPKGEVEGIYSTLKKAKSLVDDILYNAE